MDFNLNTDITGLLIILLLIYFSLSFKAYAKRKGENLATKEDIKKITHKTEDVKSIYSKMVEEFKIALLQEYELSKSHTKFVKDIDDGLIKLLLDLNDINQQMYLQELPTAELLRKKLNEVVIYLNKYKFRYEEVAELMHMKELQLQINETDPSKACLELLRHNTIISLSYFIPRLKPYLVNNDKLLEKD